MTRQQNSYIFTSRIDVDLVQQVGTDASVVSAARVSTQGADAVWNEEESEGLINFLMSNRHGTPFEHNSFTFRVSAPIFVFREFHRHRIGWCLAGDTEVWGETISPGCGRTIHRRTIADIYNRWHNGVTDVTGRTRHLPSCRNFTVRTLDESTGQFVLSRAVDVFKNGVKEVVRLSTHHGETIKATRDHAVWTPDGWAKIGDLNAGDLVGRSGKVPLSPTRQYPPALRAGIGVWTSMQRTSLIKPMDRCIECGQLFPREELELDHIVPVVVDLKLALDPDNLAPMCRPCHRIKSNGEQKLAERGQTAGSVWTKIASIKSCGEEQTYDLELEGPMRGFVANGLVVHNSYNEESGRYKQLEPKFYVPAEDRNLTQQGKPGEYHFLPGSPTQHGNTVANLRGSCTKAYDNYLALLDQGVAKEVARMALPVNIFSTMWATANARSIMAFLSLRTNRDYAAFPSKPMREIELVAEQIEAAFQAHMPITWAAFEKHGRVCP